MYSQHLCIFYKERRGSIQKTTLQRIKQVFSRRPHEDTASVGSHRSASSFRYTPNGFRRSLTPMPATPLSPPPNSETLRGFRSLYNKHQKQYTISSKKKYVSIGRVYHKYLFYLRFALALESHLNPLPPHPKSYKILFEYSEKQLYELVGQSSYELCRVLWAWQ